MNLNLNKKKMISLSLCTATFFTLYSTLRIMKNKMDYKYYRIQEEEEDYEIEDNIININKNNTHYIINNNDESHLKDNHLDNNNVESNMKEKYLDNSSVESNMKENYLDNNNVESNIEENYLDNNSVESNIEENYLLYNVNYFY